MGLFDKWRKPKPEPLPEPVAEPVKEKEHSKGYIDALSAFIGSARLHQLAFGRLVVGDQSWNVDFSGGTISFGENEYPLQFLGSESHSSGTWLWGVDNVNGFPDTVLEDVTRFYNSGILNRLQDLMGTTLEVDSLVNGHNIASLIAASHQQPACYYRCPYDGGAAFVLVKNTPHEVFAAASVTGIIETLTGLIGQMQLNHKLLVKGVMDKHCTQVETKGPVITGIAGDGNTLAVTFDGNGRIASMNTNLTD